MARNSHYRDSPSPSLSARSPSPSFSAASNNGHAVVWDSSYDLDISASRPTSPQLSDGQDYDQEVDSVLCRWEDCGKPYSHLPTLINHIHNEHIGVHKSTYTCEWATCPRRGIQQASRFALISHIRAHTGEKPFTCPLPECDKSFTRSDAMAKHMRLQHNISPPLPGRGGNRKRKRDEGDADQAPHGGYTAFKVEGQTPTDAPGSLWDADDGVSPSFDERGDYFSQRRSASPDAGSNTSLEDPDDGIPTYLRDAVDPATGKIYGRSPAMVKYLVMKAKHRFVLEQHENLLEDLRIIRAAEKAAREEKEEALDKVLRTCLGPQAEFLIAPAQLPAPQSMQQPLAAQVIDPYASRTEINGSLDTQPY